MTADVPSATSSEPGAGTRHPPAPLPPPAASPARHLALGLALAACLALAAVLAFRQVGSTDLGFHLRTGESILAGEGWPHTDHLTYTLAHRPYVDPSWGWQVLAVVVERAHGPHGLVLLDVALVLALFLLLLATTRLQPAGPLTLAVGLLGGVLACETRFEARPELVSYLLLALVLHLLHRHALGRRSPLVLLPLVHGLWANVHSLFVLGWAAELAFLGGLALARKRLDRGLALALAASVAATLVNPYGIDGTLFPLTLATRLEAHNVFKGHVWEFLSPFAPELSDPTAFYPRLPIQAYRALLVLFVAAALLAIRRGWPWITLLAAAFLPLSMQMQRNMPIAVVAMLPALAWAAPLEVLAARFRAGWARRIAVAGLAAVAAAAALIALRVASDAYYVADLRTERTGWDWNRARLPIAAGRALDELGIEGRGINHLGFGGWLEWTRRQPVYIDGRLEVVGEDFFREYLAATASPDGLDAAAERWGARFALLSTHGSFELVCALSRDPRWTLVHLDGLAALFVRGPVAAARPPLAPDGPVPAVSELPGLGGPPRASRLARWVEGFGRRRVYPADDFYRGALSLSLGQGDLAVAHLSRAVALASGNGWELYRGLGASLLAAGRPREAALSLAIALADNPGDATTQALARDARALASDRASAPTARPNPTQTPEQQGIDR